MLKCVIFDLDGTLVDSEPLGFRALKAMLPDLTMSVDDLTGQFRGQKLALVLAEIEARLGRRLPPGFEQAYRARAEAVFVSELRAFPGVHEALATLPWSKCIASSGPRAKIVRSLALTDLSPYFAGNIFSAYEVGAWKPDPGLFLHAAAAMNVRPDQCVVVEDSDVGMAAAAAADMRAIRFRHDGADAMGPGEFSSYERLAEILASRAH